MDSIISELSFLARIGTNARLDTKLVVCGTVPTDSEWKRLCLTGYLAALPRCGSFSDTQRAEIRRAATEMLNNINEEIR